MNTDQTYSLLSYFKKQWQHWRWIELLLFALTLMLPTVVILHRWVGWSWLLACLSGGLLIGLFIVLWGYLQINQKLNESLVARYLNQHYTFSEYSADLLLKSDAELSYLARLQKKQIYQQIEAHRHEIQMPRRITRFLWPCVGAILLALLIYYSPRPLLESARDSLPTDSKENQKSSPSASTLPPEIKEAFVRVQPPAYTRLPATQSESLVIEAPAQSLLLWVFRFEGEPDQAYLVTHREDSLPLRAMGGNKYQVSMQLIEKGFYHVVFRQHHQDWQASDYYPLNSIPDTQPLLTLKGVEPYWEIDYHPEATLNLEAIIQDDYGLSKAYIVATVSRGEGESVKFREQRLSFDKKLKSQPRQAKLQKTIHLRDLEMAPGDELYFYVEAQDNHQPRPQAGRTEMYFLSLRDTTQEALTMELGSGLKVLPEYFRSQRQLIMDTEKLLKEQTNIAREELESRANDLGVDQKLLRLRYGKFLGEEFESSIGAGGHHHHHHHHDEEHEEEHEEEHYEGDGHGDEDEGHQKWKERRSSLSILERNEKDHDHQALKSNSSALDPMLQGVPEEVMHLHDVMEEATFFDETLKTQLKAALSQMWESELRLRTFQPEASLPYQYRALKLIKEIQQKSRVYVERIGFEPPPLEEKGKRLSGSLDKIQNVRRKQDYENEEKFPYIQKAIQLLEVNELPVDLKDPERQTLSQASQELAGIALEKPGFLQALKLLRTWLDGQLKEEALPATVSLLQRSFWQALPQEIAKPSPETVKRSSLQNVYRQKLRQ